MVWVVTYKGLLGMCFEKLLRVDGALTRRGSHHVPCLSTMSSSLGAATAKSTTYTFLVR